MYNGKQVINLDSTTRLDVHVQLDEVKHNLHIEPEETDDDSEISANIEVAATAAKNYCDHYFAHTELEYLGYNFNETEFRVQMSPFESLVSFETSEDNVDWTDMTADVAVEKRPSGFTLHFEDGLEATYIRYTLRVGYATDELPEDARGAIIRKASDIFDTERSSYTTKLVNQRTFEMALGSYVNARW